MVELFRLMKDPPVVEIDAGHTVHIMANNIIHHINTVLHQEYPLLSDHPREPQFWFEHCSSAHSC